MAQNQLGNLTGTVDRRVVSKGGSSSGSLATPANYADVNAMRTRLAAINAGYYTTTKLDQMSVNDMVYAIRVADDATAIK